MIATFIIYLAAVFIIGYTAEKFISKGEEGFYLGDRNFGAFSTAISAGATDSSGWIFIGAAGQAYLAGISTMWMLPGFLIGYFVNWFIVAPRLRKFSEKSEALSMSDFFEKRFNDKSHLLKITSSVIIIIFFVAYMGSQLSAAGKTLDAVIDFDFNTGLILSGIFVLGYSILGGYRSVMVTDVTQGVMMLLVLAGFPLYMILFQLGGFGTFFDTVRSIDPLLASPAAGNIGSLAVGIIIGHIAFGFGVPGQPHISQRFLSAKDNSTIKQGSIIAMAWIIISMTGANLLGLIGRVLLPNLEDPEYVFPTVAMEVSHPIIAGVIVGAIFAAIQSTFSSQLMVTTQAIASDIWKSVSKKEYSSKQSLVISRTAMVVLTLLAIGIALLNLQSVFALVQYAWAGLAASFAPVLIFSLYSNIATKWGAFSSMITGSLVTVIWKGLGLDAYLYEIIPGLVVSTLVLLVVSKLTKQRDNAPLKEESMNL
ncbi:solute:Na+ symporter, SSS family/sodium/proline symporter [Terribacillus aidingensis]|uniref:Sodium/proline symporter n=1 Tax=Terribacillus aidingensis TaxID=586416 RepID=A0A285N5C3_9BACI|nr:sodium/proline symporter [Terribacillus aidingensis]SNZ04047.1 solute:Na+ symporter, SSS family/sodium/proline symporter [Terribacillus aidingensis]